MSTEKESFVLTEVQRIEMKDIDGSNEVRYTALVNGKYKAMFATDGHFKPHLSLAEWIEFVKFAHKEHIK